MAALYKGPFISQMIRGVGCALQLYQVWVLGPLFSVTLFNPR